MIIREMIKMTVSFTGHREAYSEELRGKLSDKVEELINSGADTFCAGGAAGFDTLAAETVLDLQGGYPWISLKLILPCPPEIQTARFPKEAKEQYYRVLKNADSTEIISPQYTGECMKLRNMRLVRLADALVCYYNEEQRYASGTGQTVRMAQKKGIDVINLF